MNGIRKGSDRPELQNTGMALGRCLVEGDPETTSLARRSRRKTFGVSLLLEFLLLALLVAAPLLTTIAQPSLSKSSIGPFLFRGQPSTRPVTRPASPTLRAPNSHSAALSYFVAGARPVLPEPATAPIDDPAIPGEMGLGEFAANGLTFTNPGPTLPPAPSEPTKRTVEKRPLKLSEPIIAAQLITRVEPRYPPLGVQLRQSGTVVLHAIIGRDGNIRALEVVSGSGFFIQAALDAVRQWHYRPTLLNGEPVEVETTITVVFQLRN